MNTRTKSLLYVMLVIALAPLTVLMHCAEAQVELKPFSAPKTIALLPKAEKAIYLDWIEFNPTGSHLWRIAGVIEKIPEIYQISFINAMETLTLYPH